MSILMPNDTGAALGVNAAGCNSRSLLFDRFCDPTAEKDGRVAVFTRALGKAPSAEKMESWNRFLGSGSWVKQDHLLYGHLQSRLMVNMAGGVMENAGLCLDRFGMPYIPGSAVKGCARRMAIQRCIECQGDEAKAELLARIAWVFGWADTDWKPGRIQVAGGTGEPRSDFWWSMADDSLDGNADSKRNENWDRVGFRVANRLLDLLKIRDRQHADEPWKNLPNFGGSVSFLPAFPVQISKDHLNPRSVSPGTLDLDIVTCHHPAYYAGERTVATDDEEPNPVVFPSVAAGHVFAFAVCPLRDCSDEDLRSARVWLANGLELFGLGAKTNAGYGWFDCGDELQQAVRAALDEAKQRRQEEEKQAAEDQRRQEAEQKRAEEAARLKALTASMTPEQRSDFEIAQLTNEQFRGRLDSFSKRQPIEQQAIVRALRLPPGQPGSRRQFWDDLKAKAQRGGKPAQVAEVIRLISKQLYPGKEGKMP